MAIDRISGEQDAAAGSARRPRCWFAPLRTIALTWLSIAAAPILWASVDSASAMAFRSGGHFGFHRPTQRQVFRAPKRTNHVGINNRGSHWATRRLGSRIIVRQPPPGQASNPPPPHHFPPRHPPHPPIVIGTPQLPPTPIGVTSVVPPTPPIPPGPPGPSGAGAGAGGPPPGAVSIAADPPYVRDEVLVSFTANVSRRAIERFAQDQRLARLDDHPLPLINTVLYRFRITDRRQVPAVIGGARTDARVATIQPNYLYRLQQDGAARPPIGVDMQYVVSKLHLPQAHDLATGNHVLVAVIDTGIDTQHPELRGAVAAGFDAVHGDLVPDRHGTAMASAIMAHGQLMGVAPAAHILAVRAFDGADAGGGSTTTRIVDALQWTATSAARVVNMSFAGPADEAMRRMIVAARQKGMVLVAAAGNDGPQAPPDYPAAYPGVIAVTATDSDDHLLRVANRGAYVAVAAPGVDVFVATPNAGYGYTTGTSVATAHVSGLAALLLERNPRLTPDAVQAVLTGTAKDLGPKGRDDKFGAGLVDAYAALLAVTPPTAVSRR